LGSENPSWPAIGKVVLEKGPILAFCLAFTAVAFEAKRFRVEPEVTIQPLLVARVAQASFGACFYLAKTVWPFGLTAFYPRPERGDFQTPLFAMCFAGVAFMALAALWQRRRRPWLLAALAAYLVLAFPYLGLVRVSVTLAPDRYCHAPTMAWVVLGCAGLCRLAERRWSRPVIFGAAAGTLLTPGGLVALCSAQCRVWDSGEHLWSHALKQAGWSSELHHFMGTTLAEEGKYDRALADRRNRQNPEAHHVLGAILVTLGRKAEAAAEFEEVLRLRPDHAQARAFLALARGRRM
jgi:Tetratricopeptide repeat